MTETPPEKNPPFGVDWVKALAGALAAVSTTVLLSTLGAAGTLVGAAVGSLAATIGTALYSHGLDRSRARMRQLSVMTMRPMPATPGPSTPTETSADWRERLRELPWRRVLPAAIVTFLVVLAAVTAFELASGRTLASTVGGGHGGGTTLSHVTDPGTGSKPTHRAPANGGANPSTRPSTSAPSAPASHQPSTVPTTAPSGGASTGPSSDPSSQPSPTDTPTAPAPSGAVTPETTPAITPAVGAGVTP